MSTSVMEVQADPLTQALIVQLLENDLALLVAYREAEELQVSEALSASAGSRANVVLLSETGKEDEEVALQIALEDIQCADDATIAQNLRANDASMLASFQCAQRLAASEKLIALDAEFASRLQTAANQQVNTDAVHMQDAERLLGAERISEIYAADPNDKGKNKETADEEEEFRMPGSDVYVAELDKGKGKGKDIADDVSPYSQCQICFEACQPTYSPLAASQSANSSSRVTFAIQLPCPCLHVFCISCITSYLLIKLEPGDYRVHTFPIPCPGCTITHVHWSTGIEDEVAARVLDAKDMSLWHQLKKFDTLPRIYCPNPRCSELLVVEEHELQTKSACSSCGTVLCTSCRTVWHEGLSCDKYQALPPDERSPEDRQVLALAKAQHWRRCPGCAVVIELTSGCNHIICRCKTNFCYKCGALWDGKCTRVPSCELWDEELLLEAGERERERNAGIAPARPPSPIAENAEAEPEPPQLRLASRVYRKPTIAKHDSFDWLLGTDRSVSFQHRFTRAMIVHLTCGYCKAHMNSLADLRYHLSHVRRHQVHSCCRQFFAWRGEFDDHLSMCGDHSQAVSRSP